MSDERKSQSTNNTPAKNKTNRNAMVHGLYASEIILPWESEQEFERLHQDLKEEWSPCGRMELETVFALARLFWIKRRLMRTWELGFRKDPLVQDIVNSGKKSWAEIHNYLRDQAKNDFSAGEAAKDLHSKMQATLQLLSEELGKRAGKGPDWDNIHKLHQQWQVHMGQIHKFFLLPAKTEHPSNRTQILDQAYEPEALEKIVRLEAALDTRIDKTVARLVNLKEYKRLVGLKPITLDIPQHARALPEKVVERKNATS
jgi:hypothetical protein